MRRTIVGVIGGVALWAFATPSAQAGMSGTQDQLWLAWIGCWEGAAEVGGEDADSFVVCFQPLGSSAVQIQTYTDGELVSVEDMFADGNPRSLQEGGCSGERTADWSEDQSRVFLVSELNCGEGVTRTTRGILSMLPGGQGWVEIQSVQAGEETPLVGIRTFTPAVESVLEREGITDPAAGRELAVRTARSQASGALTPDALVEVVDRVGPGVASALVVERGEPYGLEAETLRALSDRGVPGEVLDVMVAMSYPDRFQISGGGAEAEPEVRTASASRSDGRGYRSRRGSFRGYSPWGLGFDPYWDPFLWGGLRYGYGYGYGGFGYSPYGVGYYGPSVYRSPRLIFIQPPTVQDRRTVLSRTRGVRDGAPVVRSGPSSASPSRSPRSSGSRAAPSSSRGGSRAAPSSRSSGGSSGNVRRARPR